MHLKYIKLFANHTSIKMKMWMTVSGMEGLGRIYLGRYIKELSKVREMFNNLAVLWVTQACRFVNTYKTSYLRFVHFTLSNCIPNLKAKQKDSLNSQGGWENERKDSVYKLGLVRVSGLQHILNELGVLYTSRRLIK